MDFNELYPKKKEYYYLLRRIKTLAECYGVPNFIIDKQEAKLLMRYLNKKEKEIERLNNIINEFEKDMIERYHKEIDYQSKIMQSDLMQGDYPASYYAEQNEKLLNYYLNKLQELKGDE